MNNLFSYSKLLMQTVIIVLILGIAACEGKKTAKSSTSSQKVVKVVDLADTNEVAKSIIHTLNPKIQHLFRLIWK